MSSDNSTVASTFGGTSRITGLFSSFDTDTMVKNMCSNQQAKIDKQDQKETTYEWRNEAVDNVLDLTNDFSSTYCSTLGSSSMLKSSTYYSYNITSSSTSNAVKLTSSSSASIGDYTVKVTQVAKNANISSSDKVSANGTEVSSSNTATLSELSFANPLQFDNNGKISFSINNVNFTFSKDTTLQSMINTINTNSDANVTMKYSRLTDSFTITADAGGSNSSVSINNISGNAFGDNSAFNIGETTVHNGCDSIADINGTTVTRDSNDYTIDGITFELNKVTAGTAEETIDFNVKRDYSSTVSAISSFVSAYNTLVTKLKALTSADDTTYDYPPLTDAQKKDMSDDEIKTWEDKAKGGILHNDSDLESLLAGLKSAFFSNVGGTEQTAASIGITGGNYFDKTEKGLIVVDTDKLTAALDGNAETVISMFTGGNSTSESSEQGIVYKIRSALASYKNTATDSILDNEDKIDDTKTEIGKLEDKLDSLADRYYEKFSVMETQLSKLNSQASCISQLFSSSSSS